MNMLSAFQRQGRYEPAVLDHLDLVRALEAGRTRRWGH